MEALSAERVAVVCVHGVAAHPRYEFQDQVSGDFCDRLNERDGDGAWIVDALNPGDVLEPGALNPQPTISRVHRAADADAAHAQAPYYDIIEAYWSPLSKGLTNWLFVVNWILRIVFVPLNTTARYHATWQKQFFDYGYIGGALVLSFGLFFVSLSALWESLLSLLDITGILNRSTTPTDVINTLNANVAIGGAPPVKIVVWLFVGVIGAFLLGQGLAAIVKLYAQRSALRKNPKAIWHRVFAIGVLLAIGGTFVYLMAIAKFPHGVLGWAGVGFLVLIFVAFQLGYALLIYFMVGFFGDVQVYTTQDENDARFFAARDAILDVTVRTILEAISPGLNGGREYDRVIILAHSLGTTVAMDALVRIYQLALQGAVEWEDFKRIRAFVTAGASLEKTRYFFQVSGTAPAASYEQWRNDVYGLLFTPDAGVLEKPGGSGIFWVNYWYFEDPICNEIRSYRSFLNPGESLDSARSLRLARTNDPDYDDGAGRVICRNEQGSRHLTLLHPMLHSDYLDDPWFWYSASGGHVGVIDILTSGAPSAAR